MPSIKITASIASIFMIAGCMNMSTPVDRVVPKINFDKAYLEYDCEKLIPMLAQYKTEERELAQKQVDRGSDSLGHAFYYGWGKGDGMDTVELIKVRREIFSVEKSIVNKNCK